MSNRWQYPLKVFILGSSFPVLVLPLIYMGIPHMLAKIKLGRNPLKAGSHYEMFPLFLPIYYGLFAVFAQTVGRSIVASTQLRLALFGGLAGLLLSVLGRFGAEFPKRLFSHVFNYAPEQEYIIHLLAIIFYAFEFGVILFSLLKLFGME